MQSFIYLMHSCVVEQGYVLFLKNVCRAFLFFIFFNYIFIKIVGQWSCCPLTSINATRYNSHRIVSNAGLDWPEKRPNLCFWTLVFFIELAHQHQLHKLTDEVQFCLSPFFCLFVAILVKRNVTYILYYKLPFQKKVYLCHEIRKSCSHNLEKGI